MNADFEKFKALHAGRDLFILPNAWDAASAQLLQRCGYKAIGTSSAAVAEVLGYDDGERMPLEEYLVIIRRIVASVDIPVTVDLEMGYGKTPEAIYQNVLRVMDAGVTGINLEDSMINQGKRMLQEAEVFAGLITFLRQQLRQQKKSLFINVRCDTYLLNAKDKETESVKRLKLYEAAGADGIFLPFIHEEKHVALAVTATSLPVNVMVVPDLPDLATLNRLGVKRVSMGPFLQKKTYSKAEEIARKVYEQKNIKFIL
jgi:2-methylisocitrate lyase-like PEP mutase family enzyme